MEKMASFKPYLVVRMREEDKELIQKISKYFDISEADVVKMALKEFVKNHRLENLEGVSS
ncbi:plasmid copy-number control protein [Sulfolobus islandicus L.S.2.15]|uniref:Plasmid copy-number control protein n=2 Tax=Saccharolobus islandicus TaxID=43080 RepID=C3MR35_SACI2|nr:plasmid copy-number control protein [Sulfolobus islandicus L.S.2.15]